MYNVCKNSKLKHFNFIEKLKNWQLTLSAPVKFPRDLFIAFRIGFLLSKISNTGGVFKTNLKNTWVFVQVYGRLIFFSWDQNSRQIRHFFNNLNDRCGIERAGSGYESLSSRNVLWDILGNDLMNFVCSINDAHLQRQNQYLKKVYKTKDLKGHTLGLACVQPTVTDG
jgi:hypothetical protein